MKSVLNGDAIQSATEAIKIVRSFAGEKKYVSYVLLNVGEDKQLTGELQMPEPLPPRSFIFAIRTEYGSAQAIENQLKVSATEGHIHGLAVLEKDWFIHQVAYKLPPKYVVMEGKALAKFCATVLHSIQSMQILPASMQQYLKIG